MTFKQKCAPGKAWGDQAGHSALPGWVILESVRESFAKKTYLLSSFLGSRLWRFPSPMDPMARIHLHSPNRCLFWLRGLPQGPPIDIPANDSRWSWPLIPWTFDCCHCEGLKVLIATKSWSSFIYVSQMAWKFGMDQWMMVKVVFFKRSESIFIHKKNNLPEVHLCKVHFLTPLPAFCLWQKIECFQRKMEGTLFHANQP